MRGALLVDLPLVLDDHVLLVDGFQQSRGQRLQVRDGLRGHGQTAAVFLRLQQFLHCARKTKISGRRRTRAHASSKPTLFSGENSRQRAAVGLCEGFRVFPTLQGALKSQKSQSEHHRRQNTSYANSCCTVCVQLPCI